MSHGKPFHSLAAGAIGRTDAPASVCKEDPLDAAASAPFVISVRIGIDDREHVRVLKGGIRVVASA